MPLNCVHHSEVQACIQRERFEPVPPYMVWGDHGGDQMQGLKPLGHPSIDCLSRQGDASKELHLPDA